METKSFQTGSSRRQFIRSSAVAAAASTLSFPYINKALGANEKINVAAIGAGGKGSSDIDSVAACGGNIVAMCDVDENHLNAKAKKYTDAKLFKDFRKMLEQMEKSIDAVIVSTPDHLHGVQTAMAMKMGKHVYTQKPLTQTVYEARVLRQLAKDKKVATQMGNQGSANDGLRRAVEVIQAGLLGNITELHVWTNRPIWPQGQQRPEGSDPVPAGLDWDLWLGPAANRPFKDKWPEGTPGVRKGSGVYHPFAWRGWYDFGTGALGDMACHTVNMPFRALKLGYPTAVECEATSQLVPEMYPLTSRIRFDFPAREGLCPMKFWWYDGNPDSPETFRPNPELTKEILAFKTEKGRLPGSGCLIVGDKGKLFSPDDYGAQFFVMLKGDEKYKLGIHNKKQPDSISKIHEACRAIPEKYTPAPEGGAGHYQEWINMMKNPGCAAYSNFDIAAYLTEIILLGCIASRVGVKKCMQWDGPNMKSPNCPEAAKFVKRESRKGWEI